MRVGINLLTLRSHLTGVGVHALNLIQHLALLPPLNIKEEYYLIVNREARNHFQDLADNFHSITCPQYAEKPARRIPWENFLLNQYLKKYHLDLLHNPTNTLPIFFWSRCPNNIFHWLKTTPMIVTIHDLIFLKAPKTYPLVRRYYYFLSRWLASKQANLIITVSNTSKEDLVQHFSIPEHRIKVIYNGVNDYFQPMPEPQARAYLLEKYSLPEKFFLYVGYLDPSKNLTNLVKAFNLFKSTCQDKIQLVIAGKDRWQHSEVYKLVKELDLEQEVYFTGFVSPADLVMFYNAALALILPSWYEGFGLPVLEAMACQTPVLCSNIPALHEVAAEAALYFKPNEVNEIAAAMKQISVNISLRNSLAKKGYERSKLFSWKENAQQTRQVYQEIFLNL